MGFIKSYNSNYLLLNSCKGSSVTLWVPPGTVATGISGDNPWNNDDNVKIDDGSYAYTTVGGISEYLRCYNFGFSIDTSATINGLEFRVQRYAAHADSIFTSDLRIYNGISFLGDNKADSGTYWSVSEETVTYGGASDTWGYSLTPTIVNNSVFSIAIEVDEAPGKNSTAYIDYVEARIYYT